MCKSRNLNYSKVLSGVLASGYINEEHTHVPGPDGKCGYGGKCFPKDVMAFSHECQHDEMFKLVGKLQEINHVFRNEE